jgi:hypothetical protein
MNPAPSTSPATPQAELTPAQGWSRLSELRADEAFKARVRSGDTAAIGELRAAESAIRGGVTYTAGAGVDLQALGQQAVDSAAANAALEKEHTINNFRLVADIPESVAQQIRESRPVTREERRQAEALWGRLSADEAWVQRWLKGDRECRTQATLISIIKGSPLADS